MNEDIRVTCATCGLETTAQLFKPISDRRGRGLIALFTCPICGDREQSFIKPGEIQPGDGNPDD